MKHIVVDRDHIFGPWIARATGGSWYAGQGKTIGLIDDEAEILAATLFSFWNTRSMMMHCAGEGKGWLSREFLWFNFHYAFEQIGVEKLVSPVEADNYPCRRFIEHIGFREEACLIDAAPGGDLLFYTMRREDCRWTGQFRERVYGQAQSASNS
jgi:hypothetical protein